MTCLLSALFLLPCLLMTLRSGRLQTEDVVLLRSMLPCTKSMIGPLPGMSAFPSPNPSISSFPVDAHRHSHLFFWAQTPFPSQPPSHTSVSPCNPNTNGTPTQIVSSRPRFVLLTLSLASSLQEALHLELSAS